MSLRGIAAPVIAALSAVATAAGAAAPAPWRQADFAARLYSTAVSAAPADENVVISPYGVASLFALLQTGAKGDTAQGMAFALQLGGAEPPKPKAVAATFREARKALSRAAREDVTLELSDSLWLASGFTPRKEFLSLARDAFDAEVRGSADQADINAFVSEKTHGRIPILIEQPLPPTTRLVAVDTIYLKAKWESPFEKKSTYSRTFHAPSGDFGTPFLHATRHAEILDAPECAALRLPYRGGTLEMLVILPNEGHALAEIESLLGRPYLDKLASVPWRGEAKIAVPKFEFDSKHDLKPILEPMGMGTAFDVGRADFSGIADALILYQAIQKANITVDEDGTEASAATYAVMITKSIPREPDYERQFVADRPFLFLIRETRTGLILFLGRVTKPQPPK